MKRTDRYPTRLTISLLRTIALALMTQDSDQILKGEYLRESDIEKITQIYTRLEPRKKDWWENLPESAKREITKRTLINFFTNPDLFFHIAKELRLLKFLLDFLHEDALRKTLCLP